MRTGRLRIFNILAFLLFVNFLSAQSGIRGNLWFWAVIAAGIIIFALVVLFLLENLLNIEADKQGMDMAQKPFKTFPRIGGIFGRRPPAGVDESNYHRLSKGHDIKLSGRATGDIVDKSVSRVAIRPQNFLGMSPIPKLTVAEGDEVKAGDAVLFDKQRPDIKYVAPVSGEVVEIRRGAKRAITDVVILADKEIRYREHKVEEIASMDRDDIVKIMVDNGLWPLITQRPYDIVPDVQDTPRDIFISTFDSAPLAPDSSLVVDGRDEEFQKGIDVLNKLTTGTIYLGVKATLDNSPVFMETTGVERHYFQGKHPAGNVGVQIHHISPIRSGENVWTLGVQDVITIGTFFAQGIYDASRIVAVAGNNISNPRYYRSVQGASIGDLLSEHNVADNSRIISGDVLSGKQSSQDSFLNFKDDQISVIEEGNRHEMFGWLLPVKPRPSVSKTFPGFLMKEFEFNADTNTHGEERAFVVTGEYESVLPMNIYPQHLMKAILAGDFERMEGLGINELSEEDIALCEFACTSKQPLQSILRDGLDMMREQS